MNQSALVQRMIDGGLVGKHYKNLAFANVSSLNFSNARMGYNEYGFITRPDFGLILGGTFTYTYSWHTLTHGIDISCVTIGPHDHGGGRTVCFNRVLRKVSLRSLLKSFYEELEEFRVNHYEIETHARIR